MRAAWPMTFVAAFALVGLSGAVKGQQPDAGLVPTVPPAVAPAGIPQQAEPDNSSPLAGLTLTAEFLLLRPNREGLGAAVVSNTQNGTTFDSLESLSWNATPAFRVGARYLFPDSDVEFGPTFTYFHAKDQRTIDAPPGGSLLGTLATDHRAKDATSADADAGLSYAVLDLDASKSARLSDSLAVRAFGGVRLASINQSLKSIYTGGSLGSDADYVNSPVRYYGAGLTAGGEANWTIYQGWGFYGRGRLGLLSGAFDSKFRETVGSTLIDEMSERYFTVTPVTELGAGLGYQSDSVFFTVGYEMTDYLNFVSGIGGPGPNGGLTSRRRGDLTLEALTVRLGFTF